MCSEREATAKGIFSAPFGGHLGIMQIIPCIELDFVYVMRGTYLKQMVNK